MSTSSNSDFGKIKMKAKHYSISGNKEYLNSWQKDFIQHIFENIEQTHKVIVNENNGIREFFIIASPVSTSIILSYYKAMEDFAVSSDMLSCELFVLEECELKYYKNHNIRVTYTKA